MMTHLFDLLDLFGIYLLGANAAMRLEAACRWLMAIRLYGSGVIGRAVRMSRYYLRRDYFPWERLDPEALLWLPSVVGLLRRLLVRKVWLCLAAIVLCEWGGVRYPRVFLLSVLLVPVFDFFRRTIPPGALFLGGSFHHTLELANIDLFPHRMVNLMDISMNRHNFFWRVSNSVQVKARCIKDMWEFDWGRYHRVGARVDGFSQLRYADDNMRIRALYDWVEVAHWLAKDVKAIVIDTRLNSGEVAAEARLILGSELRGKVVAIIEESGEAPVLKEFGLDGTCVDFPVVKWSSRLADHGIVELLETEGSRPELVLALLRELDRIESDQKEVRAALKRELYALGLRPILGVGGRIELAAVVLWTLVYGAAVAWHVLRG